MSSRWQFAALLHDAFDVGTLDQQRARRFRHPRGAVAHGHGAGGEARVEVLDGPQRRVADRRVVALGAEHFEARPHGVGVGIVDEARERRDGLEAHFLRRVIEQRQELRDLGSVAELAERAHHGRQRALVAGARKVHQRGQGAPAADLGECVDRPLAHPPVLVARGFDQEVDRALVLGLVQDLDRRAADVLVRVADQLERGLDDARAADLARARRRRGRAPTSRRP